MGGESWTFIILFGAVIVVWMLVNTLALARGAFDPYPYILLNLAPSCLAALQALVIMMSQNRQEACERFARLLAVLAHHDDRCLEGGQAGQHEIEQDIGIGVERAASERQGVHQHPDDDDGTEQDDERPASAEARDPVGDPLAQRQPLLELHLDIRWYVSRRARLSITSRSRLETRPARR